MKSKDVGTATTLLGCFGIFAFMIIYVAIAILLRAILVYYYFDWFVTPVTEWQLQGFIHALGFAGAWMYMVNGVKIEDIVGKEIENKNTEEQTKIILTLMAKQFLFYAVALLSGYIFHLLM